MLFNLLPGQGLGFSGSKEIAFGLGAVSVSLLVSEGGGINWRRVDYSPKRKPRHRASKRLTEEVKIIDNAYSSRTVDDKELFEIIQIAFEVID